MKKHTLTLTALALTAALLAGCSNTPNTPNPAQGGDSTTTQSASTTTESTDSTTSESTPDPAPKERFIYGETEIPDISLSSGEYNGSYIHVNPDGRIDINGMGKRRYDDRLLESMVFETHTFGDYTISLVGDDVRTDKEHFPGIIYTQGLRVEIERNGGSYESEISGMFSTPYFTVYPVGDFYSEELLFEDQIGNYLDMYDTKCPVIAMRYFNADDVDEPLRKIVHFAWIDDDGLVDHFTGKFAENTGVATGGCPIQFSTGDMADPSYSLYAVFSADEFKVENENTLVDETAGIKYIFDFDKTDDTGHYFSTEKIG